MNEYELEMQKQQEDLSGALTGQKALSSNDGPTVNGFFIRDSLDRVWDGKAWRGFGVATNYRDFKEAWSVAAKLQAHISSAHPKARVNGKTIHTSFDYPPIPDRRFDWSCIDEDYDGAPDAGRHSVGHGRTEAEAVADYLAQEEEREEFQTARP